ncbi:MAG: flippase-like domain-containing protein [Verrucomicrobia bacterium]|nr:flippase-like domain-containing protein [Verrucomicrobiota bacterium]
MKKTITRTFQAIFTIGILVWVFHDPTKRAQMAAAFTKADPSWMLIGLPIAFAGEIANIMRWRILLRVQGMYLSWGRSFLLFFVGLFFNLFMPGYTGGDFARLYYLMREFPDRKKQAVLTIVMDRLIGIVALVLTAAATTFLRWDWLRQTPKSSVLLWTLVVMLIGFTVMLVGSFTLSGLKVAERLPHHFPFRERIVETSEAYHEFARAKLSTSYALLLSFPVLFSFYGAFYCSAQAVHASVSPLDMFSIMPIVTIIISLPITPSGVGFRESLIEILLRDLCGVPTQLGVLVSLLGFAFFVLFGLVGGIAYLFYSPKTRPGWREMETEVERAHEFTDS